MAANAPLLTLTDAGLYCPAGDFHIDPWRPVRRAVITHAHGDHARIGSEAYLAAAPGLPLLAARLLPDAQIETVRYGERRRIGDVDVSLHPAGHVLGSAQVRIALDDRVWLVSGDYKLAPDPTCAPFEPLRAHVFVTESTFGLPIYRWDPPDRVMADIAKWWQENRDDGTTSILFAYTLGKAQRVLAGLARHCAGDLPGPVFCHGSVQRMNELYRAAGVALPTTFPVAHAAADTRWSQTLVIAPPSARGSTWMRRFVPYSTAFASGWMAIRGARRRASYDRGFALSDHADWDGLNLAIDHVNAEEIWVTHGYRDELVRWLTQGGRHATAVQTLFEGEAGSDATVETPMSGS
ncbi:MAG TPA: ligase-associated DNA damage response exonuclease [Casimicrobiaceae bacterium]|nr:ligase-associated DNA damage response exonuclease [Casimicrobiaceae bacterium]